MKKGKLQELKLADLITADFNPNEMDEDTYKFLSKKIDERGFLQPIIAAPHPEIPDKYLIIDGAHRKQIYLDKGKDSIQAFVVEAKDIIQIKEDLINLKNTHGEFNQEKYAKLVRDIANSKDSEKLKDLINVGKGEYKKLMRLLEKEPEKEIVEDEFIKKDLSKHKPKYTVLQGDVWQLGEHRLMCGDSTIKDDVDKLMQGEEAHAVFVDPPYNLAFNGTDKGKFEVMANDQMDRKEYAEFSLKLLNNIMMNAKDEAGMYICIDYRNYPLWYNILEENQIKIFNCIVWDKVFAGMGSRYRFRHEFIIYAGDKNSPWYGDTVQEDFIKLTTHEPDDEAVVIDMKGFSIQLRSGKYIRLKLEESLPKRVPEYPINKEQDIIFRTDPKTNQDIWEGFSMNYFSQRELEQSEGIVHPTMKPLKMIADFLRNITKVNEIVIDFCGGSGSTLIAAEQINRKSRLMEIDPKYCSIIIERWEAMSGQKAEKISGDKEQ